MACLQDRKLYNCQDLNQIFGMYGVFMGKMYYDDEKILGFLLK